MEKNHLSSNNVVLKFDIVDPYCLYMIRVMVGHVMPSFTSLHFFSELELEKSALKVVQVKNLGQILVCRLE